MNDDNNVFGSHQIRQSLESFLEKALQSRVLEPKELFVRAEVHSQNSFMQFEKIAIPEVRRRQVYEGKIRQEKAKEFLATVLKKNRI